MRASVKSWIDHAALELAYRSACSRAPTRCARDRTGPGCGGSHPGLRLIRRGLVHLHPGTCRGDQIVTSALTRQAGSQPRPGRAGGQECGRPVRSKLSPCRVGRHAVQPRPRYSGHWRQPPRDRGNDDRTRHQVRGGEREHGGDRRVRCRERHGEREDEQRQRGTKVGAPATKYPLMIYGNQEKWSSIPAGTASKEYSTGQLRRGRPSGRLPWLPLASVANETPVN
jgi:hypothetical protein